MSGRRAWIGLAVLSLPTLLLAVDLSVLYLALPRLSTDLRASATQQLWITDIYGFITAGFLVTMGTLGDRIGRRKLLMIGAAGFALASTLAAYSSSPATLIAARALMGLAGAALMPSTLALIGDSFPEPSARAAAIAIWTSCFMIGAAAGPIVGGVLLQHYRWGTLFLLGVPVMAILLVAAPYTLPEYRHEVAARIDALSVALSLGAILPMVYAVKIMARDGLTIVSVSALLMGAFCAVVFIRRQSRVSNPLLDLRLFEQWPFTASLLVLMLAIATQGGIMLLISEHLQIVEGYPPLRAGMALLPASVAMIVGCILTPVVAQRVPPKWIVAAGMAIMGAGYIVMAQIDATSDTRMLVAGTCLVFFGIGPVAVLSQDLIVGSAPVSMAGSAAALSEASGDLGIGLGVAIFGSIGNRIYLRHLPVLPPAFSVEAEQLRRDGVAATAGIAGRLSPELATRLLADSGAAFTAGLRAVAIVSAVVALGLAVLAATTLAARSNARNSSDP